MQLDENKRTEIKDIIKNEVAPLLIGVRSDIQEVGDAVKEFIGNIEIAKGSDGKTPVADVDFLSKETTEKIIKDNTPKKGKDYYTVDEVNKIKKELTPKKGKDYLTKKEIADIIKALKPRKGVDYFDGQNGKTPVKGKDYFTKTEIIAFLEEVTPVKGIHYKDGQNGKNGDEITADDIKKKLESLKGKNRLSISAIDGLKEILDILSMRGGGGGGIGGSGNTTANPAGSNKQIQYNNNGIFGGSELYYDNVLGSLGINTATQRGMLDIKKTFTLPDVPAGTITYNYGSGTRLNDAYSIAVRVYAYKNTDAGKIYSQSYDPFFGTDDGVGGTHYTMTLNWPAVVGADGYKVVLYDDWYGSNYDYYVDTPTNSCVLDSGSNYVLQYPMITTPITGVTDLYVDIAGNLISTQGVSIGESINVGRSHDFGSGNFDILNFGKDTNGLFSGKPFRFYWEDTGGYATFDDGAGSLIYLRANLTSDLLATIILTAGQSTLKNTIIQSETFNTNPLIVRGAGATNSISISSFACIAPQTFTVTLASPAVFTASNHGLQANDLVKLTTTGALPTGITISAFYYVKNATTNTFELSTTAGGASVNTSGTQSGTHTVTMFTKVTCASAHGRVANDPVIFGGGTPLPTGITAGTTYYVSTNGLTSTVLYVKSTIINSVGAHVSTTTSGSGAPFLYGNSAPIALFQNSANSNLVTIDEYGNLVTNLLTTPIRLGHIPADSNYAGIWFSSGAVSPTSSNYSFLGDVSNTFLNGPTNVFIRTANTTRLTITSGLITVADATNLAFSSTTGSKLGTATTDKIAFHNSTPVVQRAGASQASVATTASTNITPYGYTTSAQADAIVTLVNEIRATLVEKGLMKGSA